MTHYLNSVKSKKSFNLQDKIVSNLKTFSIKISNQNLANERAIYHLFIIVPPGNENRIFLFK